MPEVMLTPLVSVASTPRWGGRSRRLAAIGLILTMGCQSAGAGGLFGRKPEPAPAAETAQAPESTIDPDAPVANIPKDDDSRVSRAVKSVVNAFGNKSAEQGAKVENVVRGPDGAWRIDPRQAGAEEKRKSGYNTAEQLFREEKYDEAARKFKKVAKNQKDTPLAEEALFMKAECYFKANRLSAAQDAYSELLTKFPTTRFLPQAIQRQYDIAYYWLEDSQLRAQGKPGRFSGVTQAVNLFDRTRPLFDTPGRAIQTIETIQQYDPLGPLTDDAVMMAAAHEFTGSDYVQAASYYEQVVNDQPKSEHATRAFVLGAQSYLRSYQGPQYDGSDLAASERLGRQALTRAVELTPDQRTRLEEDMRVIYLERAKRYYHVGEQYLMIRKPQAARYYFEKVTMKYPDTPWAKKAEEQVKRIEVEVANAKPSVWQQAMTSTSDAWNNLWKRDEVANEEKEEARETKDASTVNEPGKDPKGAAQPKKPQTPRRVDFEREMVPGLPRTGIDPR